MKRANQPPLGARPKFVFDEMRIEELSAAIGRFVEAHWPIPTELIQEYNELTEKLPKDDTDN